MEPDLHQPQHPEALQSPGHLRAGFGRRQQACVFNSRGSSARNPPQAAEHSYSNSIPASGLVPMSNRLLARGRGARILILRFAGTSGHALSITGAGW